MNFVFSILDSDKSGIKGIWLFFFSSSIFCSGHLTADINFFLLIVFFMGKSDPDYFQHEMRAEIQ
jgi:hypothetical protein